MIEENNIEPFKGEDGKYYYAYKITCMIPEKPYYYYGVHVTKRMKDSYTGNGSFNFVFYNRKARSKYKSIVEKYGKENFKKEILYFFNNYDELSNAEIEIIGDLFKFDKWCMNLRGGGLNGEISEEQRKRISDKLKGRKLPEATVEKMRRRKMSEENKKKVSERTKGVPLSEETKRKIRESQIGKKKEKPPWNKGMSFEYSEEARRKNIDSGKKRWQFEKENGIIRKLRKVPVIQFSLNGNYIATYESVIKASENTGCWPIDIRNCICNKKELTKGYIWKRAG